MNLSKILGTEEFEESGMSVYQQDQDEQGNEIVKHGFVCKLLKFKANKF